MNPQQAENLRVLIRHMEANVTRTLNMTMISECGTPACAMGEACVIPAFNAIGYSLPRHHAIANVLKHGVELPFCTAAEELFGASNKRPGDQLERLFAADSNNAWHRPRVSPQEWAIEARKVLAENGYTMDDPFKRFMDKVREPVSLGSYALAPR